MDVTKRIVRALREEYDAGQYDVYTESIEQGFTEPCFSIRLLQETRQQYPGGRTLVLPYFDVRYFPSQGTRPREECRKVADKLAFLLRELPGVRGTGIESEVTDGVLHFFVSYPHFIREAKTQENMGTLETNYASGG